MAIPSNSQIIKIKLTPHAKQNKILGWQDDILRASVTAAPADGQANEALLKLLAKEWKIGKTKLQIIKGKSSREKLVKIT